MAVRLTSLGGSTEWADGNVLSDADLTDTFHAVVSPPVGSVVAWAKSFGTLVAEGFEGVGAPAAWTTDAGAPDYDYTTQARGVQSLQVAAADERVTKTFAAQAGNFTISFWFRPLATNYGADRIIMGIRTSGSDVGTAAIVMTGTTIGYRETANNNAFSPAITTAAQWYRAVIIGRKATNVADFYIFDSDGVTLLGSATSIGVASLVNDRVHFDTNNATGVAIDDVTVYGSNAIIPQDLGNKWVECNGQVLSDTSSVFNGATIPDLNAQAGTSRFLSGAITSGTTGGAATVALVTAELPAHTHSILVHDGVVGNGNVAVQGVNASTTTQNTGSTGSGTAHENRPPYYEVVWIMRVR